MIENCEATWKGFIQELIYSCIDTVVCRATDEDPDIVPSQSYQTTLCAWASHLIQSHQSLVDIEKISSVCLVRFNSYTSYILDLIMSSNDDVKEHISDFVGLLKRKAATIDCIQQTEPADDIEQIVDELLAEPLDVSAMDHQTWRLRERLVLFEPEAAHGSLEAKHQLKSNDDEECERWSLMDATTTWKPSPIGSLSGGVIPSLELPSEYDDVEFMAKNGILQIPTLTNSAQTFIVNDAYDDEMATRLKELDEKQLVEISLF